MATHADEPPRFGESGRERKWIPILVPGAAAVIVSIIFLGTWLVLRHY